MKMIKVCLVAALIMAFAGSAFSGEIMRSAKIMLLNGNAVVKKAGQDKWQPAVLGMILKQGDTLWTKSDAWVVVKIDGDGETADVEVAGNSQLMFSELTRDAKIGAQQTLLDLAIGEILIKAKKLHSSESRFEVKTPTSVVGVRGTKFAVKVEALDK